ncbi:tagatose-6-phosphate kinase [Dolosicoccus paucivorans]|uniref:tagatose-6-phosphate kinase n=1 Tax=Dolosicoccus paucivorans TaxID=84521 RepID=UPI00088BA7B9|nr:tagatose-6-phosphate kinase [Dolosicoccus paucivorans]SDI76714.1 tagatose 6-phosphate kinase [Dolosicoccus paucivorans]
MSILTVTMNPSVDIAYQLPTFKLDDVNRVSNVNKSAGGKGLNVTRVLKEIDEDLTATGLVGGDLGNYIKSQLDQGAIHHDFYQIKGNTRNCIAILHKGMQTEILESGPTISDVEGEAFKNHFESLLKNAEVVSISGSTPSGLATDYYAELITIANAKEVPVVLDTSGESLRQSLLSEDKPKVIKPNVDELSQLLGRELDKDLNLLKEALQDSLFNGVEWVIVSLGSEGAFAKHHDLYYKVDIPTIDIVNPVGSGDSTVAGIVSGITRNYDDVKLLKHANVLGMLNAQEEITGHVNLNHYEALFNKIQVRGV